MKERLDQLTLKDLIEISCGEFAVLAVGDEETTLDGFHRAAVRIIAEYKAIASPAQYRMDMSAAEKLAKLRFREKCARIAMALCRSDNLDLARGVLLEYGIEAEFLKDKDAILARCQAIIGEVEYERNRIEEYNAKSGPMAQSPDQLRRTWYSEIAGVMSTLKVPVPMDINAAIYANLVHQAVERNKALSKMPPMAGMFM